MRQLKLAMIGGGFMGRAHSLAYALAPIAENLNATISKELLVDVDERRAATLAAQLGWRRSSAEWLDAVRSEDIDVVDICTPPALHAELAVAAIAAGKHVFCEKPLANSTAEALRIRDAARGAGVVTQAGFNYRHTPAITFAKQLLEAGAFGEPLQFRSSYLQDAAFGADPTRWRAQRNTGGSGMVGDIGSHIIDLAEYLFGDIVKVAARVRAKSNGSAGWVEESDRVRRDTLDDGGVWIAEFANHCIGSFAVNAYSSGHKNQVSFEFDATEAAVEFSWNDRGVFKVSYVNEKVDHQGFRTIHTNVEHPNGWWRLAGLGTGYVEISAIQFQKFFMAILTGDRASPDFSDAAHVQQVVEAVLAASLSDGWVTVPARPAE